MQVQFTRLTPLYPRAVFLQWDVLDGYLTGNYLVDLYRGEAPSGPWTTLISTANTYSYLDTLSTTSESAPNLLALSRDLHYKVVVKAPDGSIYESVSIIEPQLSSKQYYLKRKFLRDAAVGLRLLNGTKVAVVKRQHWGTRCPKCTDSYTKAPVRGACTTCMGTGFTPGYHTPIVTYAKRSPAVPATTIVSAGKQDITPTRVTLLDIPKVAVDDILVFMQDNRRLLVQAIGQTELKTVGIHQTVMCSEINRAAIEYKIIVDSERVPALF